MFQVLNMKTIESVSEATEASPVKKIEKAQIVTEDRIELEISQNGVQDNTKEPLESVPNKRNEIILELDKGFSSESETLDSESEDLESLIPNIVKFLVPWKVILIEYPQ